MKILKSFKCSYCKHFYHDWDFFQRHKRRHKTANFHRVLSSSKKKKYVNSVKTPDQSFIAAYFTMSGPVHGDKLQKVGRDEFRCLLCSPVLVVDDEQSLDLHNALKHCCTYCSLIVVDVKSHMNDHHRCEYCHNFFASSDLKAHINSYHSCSSCNVKGYRNVTQHFVTDHKISKHVIEPPALRICWPCKMEYPTKCSRNWHFLKWHNLDFDKVMEMFDKELQSLQCFPCGTHFKSEEELKDHWVDREKIGIPQFDKAISHCDLKTLHQFQHEREVYSGGKVTLHECSCKSCRPVSDPKHSPDRHQRKLQCPFCRMLFNCNLSMFQHIELNHACKVCHKCYAPEAMKYHLENDHFCLVCQDYYFQKGHKLGNHKCPFCCPKAFTGTYASVLKHMNEAHRCEYCSIYVPSNLLAHHRDLNHRCKFCYHYFSPTNFGKHKASMHPCPYCQGNFMYKELTAHLEETHKCSFCGECYSAQQMTVHMAQEKKCHSCCSWFASPEERRVHTSKSKKCTLCNVMVNCHTREEHMKCTHRCKYCLNFFENLVDHREKCDMCPTKYKCPICNAFFVCSKKELFLHVNSSHVQVGKKHSVNIKEIVYIAAGLGSAVLQCKQCFKLFGSECDRSYHCMVFCNKQKLPLSLKCANCKTSFHTSSKPPRHVMMERIKRHEDEQGHCSFSSTCRVASSNLVQHANNRREAIEPSLAHICKYCKASFSNSVKLTHHMEREHVWPCPHCKIVFPWEHKLNQHKEAAHTCMKCDQEIFSTHKHVCRELMIKSSCGFCKKRIPFKDLEHHYLSVHKCPYCDVYLKEVASHVKRQHRCNDCQVEYYDLFMHVTSEHVCCHCRQHFQTKELLLSHVFTTHLCYDCCWNLVDSTPVQSQNTDLYMKDCSYKCAHCHCYFPESLIRCRVNLDPVCAFCAEIFGRASIKITCANIQTVKQPKKMCEYTDCDWDINMDALLIHKRTDHKCWYCPKFLSCKDKLQAHIETKHSLNNSLPVQNKRTRCVQKHIHKKKDKKKASQKEQDLSQPHVLQQDSGSRPSIDVQGSTNDRLPAELPRQALLLNHRPVGNHVGNQNPAYKSVILNLTTVPVLQNPTNQDRKATSSMRSGQILGAQIDKIHFVLRKNSFQNPYHMAGKESTTRWKLDKNQGHQRVRKGLTAKSANAAFQKSVLHTLNQQLINKPDGMKNGTATAATSAVLQMSHQHMSIRKSTDRTDGEKNVTATVANAVCQKSSQQQTDTPDDGIPNETLIPSIQTFIESLRRVKMTPGSFFRCGEYNCHKLTKTLCQAIWHFAKKHRANCNIKCGGCGKQLGKDVDIVAHEMEKLHCVYCSEGFSSRGELFQHWVERSSVLS